MNERWAEAWGELPLNLSSHLRVTVVALALAMGVGLPMGVWVARRPVWRAVVMGAVGIVQTIPGLALLALMVPVFAALGGWLGIEMGALGFYPAVAALTMYGLLPIVRNAVAGIEGVSPTVVEAARGLGMNDGQILRRVELPIASPVILAGVRTAAVWVVGTATLATPVGQRSLGNFIFSGLQTRNWPFVLMGCGASAMLAVTLDVLLGQVERGVARRQRWRSGLAAGALVAVFAGGLVAPWAVGKGSGGGGEIVVGAKTFTEQYILCEWMAGKLERDGIAVRKVTGLGSNFAIDAMSRGGVDVFVDYTGTIWATEMGKVGSAPREEVMKEVGEWLRREKGIELLGPVGFENAYALAMKRGEAERLGIRTLADLAVHARKMKMGSDYEFLQRPEWKAVREAYGLEFGEEVTFDPTFLYEAVGRGEVDVISAYTSDGRIATDDLVVLEDPKQAIPPYDAVMLLSRKAAGDARVVGALQPLLGTVDAEAMRRANARVDAKEDAWTAARAGRELGR